MGRLKPYGLVLVLGPQTGGQDQRAQDEDESRRGACAWIRHQVLSCWARQERGRMTAGRSRVRQPKRCTDDPNQEVRQEGRGSWPPTSRGRLLGEERHTFC